MAANTLRKWGGEPVIFRVETAAVSVSVFVRHNADLC